MANQKIEEQFRLALELPEEERIKTMDLDTGFSAVENRWTVIVRYVGNIARLEEASVQITQLLGGYAVVTLPENQVESFVNEPEIIYMEKPKRLNFAVRQGKQRSCFTPVTEAPLGLTGEGVLVGIVDSGIDFFHPDFRNPDGTTRLIGFWDQTAEGTPPEGYRQGRLYTEEEINEILRGDPIGEGQEASAEASLSVQEQTAFRRNLDTSGHGTAVAGITAGNDWQEGGLYTGAAPGSRLLVVKLGNPGETSFPRTTELMTGVDFLVRMAAELGTPIAVNISFGNNYGSHSGDSLVDTYLNVAADYGRTVICIGTGNEGELARHASGLWQDSVTEIVELNVSEFQPSFNIQLWKEYEDRISILLVHPDNRRYILLDGLPGVQSDILGSTQIFIYYGEPAPYSKQQELYMELIPRGDYVDAGIWRIVMYPTRIIRGDYDIWLPSGNGIQAGTAFLVPDPERTLTEPSPSAQSIAVAAYDSAAGTYAPFSGRGYPRLRARIHPALAAPGVNIQAPRAGGGHAPVTGTSFATPFVTGAAALLMEWGIVRGNDPFLYGQKVTAYLINGARQLPSEREYPNPRLGFGVLCVGDSIPGL